METKPKLLRVVATFAVSTLFSHYVARSWGPRFGKLGHQRLMGVLALGLRISSVNSLGCLLQQLCIYARTSALCISPQP